MRKENQNIDVDKQNGIERRSHYKHDPYPSYRKLKIEIETVRCASRKGPGSVKRVFGRRSVKEDTVVMFYELNDEQKAFRKRVQEIYEREVSPLVEEYERKETFPVQLFRILGAEHLLCLRCPEEYGGPGLDKVTECIAVEELNRICVGIGAGIMVQGGLATDPILHYGSEELKRNYLAPAVRGEKIGDSL